MTHMSLRLRRGSLAAGMLMLLLGSAWGAATPDADSAGARMTVGTRMPGASAKAVAYVVVSVTDLDAAIDFWVGRLGLELETRRSGSDPGLAAAWGLPADGIVEGALLRTPGVPDGGIHLVQFKTPGPAVREGASSTDLVPKSIDIDVRDLPARYDELVAAGYAFRSKPGRLETATGGVVHEVHLPAADGMNLVFLEEDGVHQPVSPKGYGAAAQIVLVTADNARETAFFREVFGLEDLSHNVFGGPEVEKTIGLPPGASLDITILGAKTSPFGRLEFVQYQKAPGRDLYPRARPPARGMLSITYFVPDLVPILERGRRFGIRDLGTVHSILGTGHMAEITSPAGLRVDILAP
jgi:catechol 2,3-dioxygenase-like lactoylglutathione lyase family enzyme